MVSSWTSFTSRCKSRVSALGRCCYQRWLHWRQKYRQAQQQVLELRETLANAEARGRQLEEQNQRLRQQVAALQSQLAEPRPVSLPLGEVPPGQQYGANLLALSVNLARELGLRPTHRALKIFSAG